MTYENLYRATVYHLADLRNQDFTDSETEWQKKLETILDQLFAHLHPIVERSRPKTTQDFTDSLLQLLTVFLRESKMKKKDFATAYGCRPSLISRFYSGDRKLNFVTLVTTIHSLGFSVKFDSEGGWVAARVTVKTI